MKIDSTPVSAGPPWHLWALACSGLACLFLASAVVLVILLVQRSRRSSPGAQ